MSPNWPAQPGQFHPGVEDVAVVAKPDDRWGESPCAFVVVKDLAAPPTAEALIAVARGL